MKITRYIRTIKWYFILVSKVMIFNSKIRNIIQNIKFCIQQHTYEHKLRTLLNFLSILCVELMQANVGLPPAYPRVKIIHRLMRAHMGGTSATFDNLYWILSTGCYGAYVIHYGFTYGWFVPYEYEYIPGN